VRLVTGCRGGKTFLAVIDQGDGMPREQIDAPDDCVAPESGIGLGLAIVRRVVALAGGGLTIELPPEGGTCVIVELPSTKPLDAVG
jgi:signal transduction histidine kinase